MYILIAVIGSVDFAAALKCTGEATVLPEAGEQTFTPTTAVVHPVGVGVGVGVGAVPTLMLKGVLKTAPLESQACTTMLWVPELTGRLTSRLAADVA